MDKELVKFINGEYTPMAKKKKDNTYAAGLSDIIRDMRTMSSTTTTTASGTLSPTITYRYIDDAGSQAIEGNPQFSAETLVAGTGITSGTQEFYRTDGWNFFEDASMGEVTDLLNEHGSNPYLPNISYNVLTNIRAEAAKFIVYRYRSDRFIDLADEIEMFMEYLNRNLVDERYSFDETENVLYEGFELIRNAAQHNIGALSFIS